MSRVVIIGAGVAGLSVASEILARGGVEILIIDRAPGTGPAQCSWWAGGMLAPWCERESAEQAVMDLGATAADWWARRTSSLVRNGTLVVAPARDRAELDRFGRRTCNFRRIDADAIATLEPDLAGRFREALFFPDEAHLDPRKTLHGLARRVTEQGADVRFGTEDLPSADVVVDCRGFAAAPDLEGLRGVKGEMLVLRTKEIALSRPVRLLHPRHPIYVVPRADGLFMLGATMIETADRTRITARSMLELLSAAYALHPAFAEAEVLEIGVDVRPAFADNLPRVVRRGGRIHVNGLYRHGFLLAPAMAARAADMALAELGAMT